MQENVAAGTAPCKEPGAPRNLKPVGGGYHGIRPEET